MNVAARPRRPRGGPVRALPLLSIALAAALAAPAALAERPRVYAITGARLVIAPGKSVDDGTIVLRDGLIEAAGRGVSAPPDAFVIEGKGRTVTAGLIDACSEIGVRKPEERQGPPSGGAGRGAAASEPPAGTAHPVARVRAERRVADQLVADPGVFEKHRAMGFTTVLSVPPDGIFRGQAAVLNLQEGPVSSSLLLESAGQVVAFERGNFGGAAPYSLMGTIAIIRQTLLDARRQDEWQVRYAADPSGMQRPDTMPALTALEGPASGKGRVFFDTGEPSNVMRALTLTHEFGLDTAVIASGRENSHHGVIEALAAAGRPVIVPLPYPEKPKVTDPDEALKVSTRDLEEWDLAPGNPAALQQAGLRFALGTCHLSSAAEFPGRLRKAMDRGLSSDTALAALTTEAARAVGLERTLGTLEAGRIANVVVWEGTDVEKGIFAEKARPVHVFVDGIKHDVEQKKSKGDPDAKVDPRGSWSVTLSFPGREVTRTWTITGKEGEYAGTAETQRGTVSFSSVTLKGNEMTVVMPADGTRPSQEITVVITGEELEGSGDLPGGGSYSVKGTRTAGPEGGVL
jgi:hypothetical protein